MTKVIQDMTEKQRIIERSIRGSFLKKILAKKEALLPESTSLLYRDLVKIFRKTLSVD